MIQGRLPACLCLATAVLLSGTARAGDTVTAEALFRAGRAASDRGDYATACAKFEESHKLDPAAGTALNLGDCSEHLGKLATAWQRFQEAADRFGADERAEIARKKVAELAPRLARLTLVRAKDAPDSLEIERDGVPIGRAALDTSVPVDAGAHTLVVRARGRAPKEIRVVIADGDDKTVACEPGPPEDRPVEERPSGSAAFPIGVAVGGLGLAGIGAGVATGLLAIDRRDAMLANCDASKACNPAGIAAASEGKTFSAVSTAACIGGGVALAAGITLVIVGRMDKAPPKGARLSPTGALTAGASPSGASLLFSGHF